MAEAAEELEADEESDEDVVDEEEPDAAAPERMEADDNAIETPD
ncbi:MULTISPECIES: hypothetical protein [Haloarcula]|uniref:Uncharacterized protein n=1 Tax=Haloarcula pellucida TaxID=1427151 RepID=A0A830GPX5_9EURY|nr:hypothetical protein GCM10009030_29520 [Halomicroarcula pellucida]